MGLRFEPGSRVPMHCTAIGKLLLSEMGVKQRERFLISSPLSPYTHNTITDVAALRHELAGIRKTGISTDNQEFMSGVVCVGVRPSKALVVGFVQAWRYRRRTRA